MSNSHLSMEYLEPLVHDPAQEAVEGFRESFKTAEEIAQFSVDESLGELERAVMFVDGGVAVQRLSVVNNLVYLVKQFRGEALDRLVPAVCEMLPRQEREIQHSASQAFRDLIEARLISKEMVSDRLLAPALQVLAQDDEAVVAAWLDTLHAMIPLLPRDKIAKDVTAFAMDMGSVTQGIVGRLLACRLLGSLSAHLSSAEIERTFFNQSMALCQDTDFDVRVCMCEQLPAIARGVGPDLARRVLLPELVELLGDEEITVRVQAVRTTVAMIPALGDDAKREQMLPLVFKYARALDPDLVDVVAESFGAMVHAMSPVLREEEADELYGIYRALAERPEAALRRWCAYNFPAVLKSMGIQKYAMHLHAIYLKLSCDPDPAVRKCIAAGIHEVCRMLGADRSAKYMREPFVSLLRDAADVALELVPNLATTLSLFKSGDPGPPLSVAKSSPYSDILPAMLLLESAVRPNWRRHLALLSQWGDLPEYYTGDQIIDNVVPLLLSALSSSPYPVKDRATQLICAYIRRNRTAAQRAELVTAIIADFAQSTDCHQRLIFLSICSAFLGTFSRRFFREFLFDEALELVDDPVPNVRRRVAMLLPIFKKVLRVEDSTQYEALKDKTATLMTDTDSEVRRLALGSAKELSRIQAIRRSASGRRGSFMEPEEDVLDAQREAEEDALAEAEAADAEAGRKRLEAAEVRARSEYKAKLTERKAAGTVGAMGRRASVVAAPIGEVKKQREKAAEREKAAGAGGRRKSTVSLDVPGGPMGKPRSGSTTGPRSSALKVAESRGRRASLAVPPSASTASRTTLGAAGASRSGSTSGASAPSRTLSTGTKARPPLRPTSTTKRV